MPQAHTVDCDDDSDMDTDPYYKFTTSEDEDVPEGTRPHCFSCSTSTAPGDWPTAVSGAGLKHTSHLTTSPAIQSPATTLRSSS